MGKICPVWLGNVIPDLAWNRVNGSDKMKLSVKEVIEGQSAISASKYINLSKIPRYPLTSVPIFLPRTFLSTGY